MANTKRYLALLVVLIGVVGVVLGAVFIGLAIQKESWIQDSARLEKVTLGLTQEQINNGEVVDSPSKMQAAADTIREHRRSIAPTYNDLLAQSGGKYDPANPKDLNYAQALNMENYLYLGVLSFGVTMVTKGVGAAFIVFGIALVIIGLLLFRELKATVKPG